MQKGFYDAAGSASHAIKSFMKQAYNNVCRAGKWFMKTFF